MQIIDSNTAINSRQPRDNFSISKLLHESRSVDSLSGVAKCFSWSVRRCCFFCFFSVVFQYLHHLSIICCCEIMLNISMRSWGWCGGLLYFCGEKIGQIRAKQLQNFYLSGAFIRRKKGYTQAEAHINFPSGTRCANICHQSKWWSVVRLSLS